MKTPSLDLAAEAMSDELPPGLPEELIGPGGPAAPRTWWQVTAGAGEQWVGRWLAAQRGWTFLTAATWAEAAARLPTTGDVFVVLEDDGDAGAAPDPRLAEADLGARRVCIAAAGAPPEQWALVTTPPTPAWIRTLIEWATARSERSGGLARRDVELLFDEESLSDSFATPGDLLDFLGELERFGVARLRAALPPPGDPLRLVRAWLLVGAETPAADPEGRSRGVVDELVELLLSLECARLTGALPRRSSAATWERLAGGAAPIARLRSRDLLRDTTGGLEIRHSWMARLLRDGAMTQLSGLSACGGSCARFCSDPRGADGSTLGALLLHPETAEDLLIGLFLEGYAGPLERIRACATAGEPRDAPSRAELAAIDGAFRAIALVLAAGADVPLELVRTAWQRQVAHLTARPGAEPPAPTTRMAAPRGERGVASLGCWYLAALLLSKRLTDEGEPPAPLPGLTPWAEDATAAATAVGTDRLAAALDAAVAALHHGTDPDDPRHFLPFAIGEQLLERVGVLRRGGRILEVQRPAVLIRLAHYEELEVSDEELAELLAELRDRPWGVGVLETACSRHAVALADVLSWCAARRGGEPEEGDAEP